MKWHIVLPSWSRIDATLEAETGCRHAAFIRLGGQPLFRHIATSSIYAGTEKKLILVLDPSAESPEVADLATGKLTVCRLLNSRSIGDSVMAGIENLEPGAAVIVNMADTLVQLDDDLKLDAVYSQKRADLYRWTTVETGRNGQIRVLRDRNEDQIDALVQQVCVGLFTFQDGQLFKSLLCEALNSDKKADEPFFSALENYSSIRSMSLVEPAHWFDCGHVDTYYESKLGYQNLRHFNTLTYDSLQGLVTKRSTRTDEFRNQVRWFKQVPDSLTAFLPRIFSSSDSVEPYVTMELLTIPTLAELFLGKRLSPGAWNGVVRTVAHIHNKLQSYSTYSLVAHQLARSVYVDKTKGRINSFINSNNSATRYHVTLDGTRFDLAFVLSSIEEYVRRAGLLEIESLSPIHGDFCFGNLLFDPKSRVVKMIDPRGEFGVPGIYGDARYDLAKLSHSFSGGFDLIVNDQFNLKITPEDELLMSTPMGLYHAQVKAIFELLLFSDKDLLKQVRAIEGLLFLSMLPLHSDAPRRQLAMLATGLRLYGQTLSGVFE